MENTALISMLKAFNEGILRITERVLPNQPIFSQENLKTILIHNETSGQYPYAELTIENPVKESRKSLFLSACNWSEAKVTEMYKAITGSTFDTLVYFQAKNDGYKFWSILEELHLEKDHGYIARFDNEDLLLQDFNGNSYDATKIIERLWTGIDNGPKQAMDDSLVTETAQQEHGFYEQECEEAQARKKDSDETGSDTPPESYFVPLVNRLIANKSVMEAVVLAKTLTFVPGETKETHLVTGALPVLKNNSMRHGHIGIEITPKILLKTGPKVRIHPKSQKMYYDC